MNYNLNWKNVLITGGTGGIGTEIVKSMHGLEANIIITGTNEKKLADFSSKFSPNVLFHSADLSNETDLEKLVENTLKKFDNRLDVLINNAGITRDNLTLRMKSSEWNEVINLNLNSTFFLTKFFLKNGDRTTIPFTSCSRPSNSWSKNWPRYTGAFWVIIIIFIKYLFLWY